MVGTQAVLGRARAARRAAVQHDAGPHPVAAPAPAASQPGAARRPNWTGCAAPGKPAAALAESGAPARRAAGADAGGSSALAKWVISVMLRTAGNGAQPRIGGARYASGVKPSRFMPVFIFRCTSIGADQAAHCSSIAICSLQWTARLQSGAAASSARSAAFEEAFQQQNRLVPAQFAQAHRASRSRSAPGHRPAAKPRMPRSRPWP